MNIDGGQRLLAHLALVLYAALIAGSFSFGALTSPFIDPIVITALRFLLAAPLIGLILLVVSPRRIRIPQAPWRFVILGGLMSVYFVLMFVALQISTPVATSAVSTLQPAMSAVFGFMLLRQPTRPTVALSLSVAGGGALWVIFHGDWTRFISLDVGRGEAIFLVGCACQAAYSPCVRLLNRGESVLESTFYTLCAASVFLVPIAIPSMLQTDWNGMPVVVWQCVAYLTVCSTAISFFLLQFGSMNLPSAKVFAYIYLVPTIVILIEGVIGHGWADQIVVVGAVLTVAGLLVMTVAPDERQS